MRKKPFISISPGFFLILLLLAQSRLERPMEMAVWLAVVTVSVLIHELGHALAAKRFGQHPTISLHMLGGTTSYKGEGTLSRGQQILITIAGPASGLLLGGLAWTARLGANALDWSRPLVTLAFNDALFVNIGWSLFNLLPVLPMDGGRITAYLVGDGPARWISLSMAAVMVFAVIGYGDAPFGVLLGGWFIIENGKALWKKRQQRLDTPLLAELKRSQALIEAGQFRESLALARDLRPRCRDTWNQHCAAYSHLWAAIQLDDKEEMDTALVTFPSDHPASPYSAGIVHQRLGRPELAEAFYTRALETDQKRPALNALLVLLASQTRHEDVLKVLGKYPAADVDAEVYISLQASFIMAGRYEDALKIGRSGVEVAEHPMVAYNLACAHARMGSAEPALSWLRKAIEGGYNDPEKILGDDDLASIRDTAEFQDLLTTCAAPV